MDVLFQLFVNGLISGATYGLIGLSFGLIYATTHFFHFSHGAIYALAAYALFTAASLLGFPAPASIVFAVAVAAIGGVGIDAAVYGPLYKRKSTPLVLLLASIGVFVIFEAGFASFFGAGQKILDAGALNRSVSFYGASATWLQIVSVIVAFTCYGVVVVAMRKWTIGRLLRAVASDAELARIRGINERAVIRFAFAVGSAIAAVAAILAAYDTGLRPTMGFSALLAGVVAAIVGGVGSLSGAFVGGLLVGMLQQYAAWVLPSRWQDLVVYAILFGVLIFWPTGILGRARRVQRV